MIFKMVPLALMLAAPAYADDIHDPPFAIGAGLQTCDSFNFMKLKFGFDMELHSYGWAQGYMSALNFSTKDKVPLDKPDDSRKEMQFLSAFCDRNPNAEYMDGVLQLYQIKHRNAAEALSNGHATSKQPDRD